MVPFSWWRERTVESGKPYPQTVILTHVTCTQEVNFFLVVQQLSGVRKSLSVKSNLEHIVYPIKGTGQLGLAKSSLLLDILPHSKLYIRRYI
mmetsp:Transcript_5739/g.12834  ORF Transcript_5739/g.12834 Transcript_5739/m.12834 type:complete len:92 (-) Transcript_5739:108-383(-)